jgi:hypothetical protein
MSDPFEALLKPVGHEDPHVATIALVDRSGRYRIGSPTRPAIRHDNGFLDRYPRREPTLKDRANRARWVAKLEASEALCSPSMGKYVEHCNREDLSDANAAYRHFLFGNGADRQIDYERYLKGDPAAVNLIRNVVNDFRTHAEIIGKHRVRFSVTSDAYTVGRGGIAPYPKTSNWQKAIGAHYLWVSGEVSISVSDKGSIAYAAAIILHIEDRYNFNPGATDIATGIPDSENGIFEVTGLAKQYTNYATVARSTSWLEGERMPEATVAAKYDYTAAGKSRKKSGLT